MVNVNSCMATTLEDCLIELGGIPASRVCLSPPPGQATLADLLAINRADRQGLFELVDGTLVEGDELRSVGSGGYNPFHTQDVCREKWLRSHFGH